MAKRYSMAIVTRTKNRPQLLKRAIESLDAQLNQDFIHVILNDGGEKKVLEDMLKEHPRKDRIIVHNNQPKGLVKALNMAIRAVDSEYVAILDDDDTWHPNRTKAVTQYFHANPEAKAVVVKMDTIVESVENGVIVKLDQYPHPDGEGSQISLFKQCNRNYLSNGILTYKRSLYDELGGYDESLTTAEDWDFGIRLMLKEDVGIVDSDGPLFYYHQRPQQMGDEGNSVHARVKEQEETINRIRNRYLRSDIHNGVAGVGFIMNATEQDLVNIVRLEGHVNRQLDITVDNIHKSIVHHSLVRVIRRKFSR
jgi:glycosyltransferase involved in cell wall biosynthesis